MMKTLTDLQVLALLAAWGDEQAEDAAWILHTWGEEEFADECPPMTEFRSRFARVFDLPARAPEDIEPIVMSLAWESDRRVEESKIAGYQALRCDEIALLAACAAAGVERATVKESVTVLCAEVLELRANAAAVLRADVGPESERERDLMEHETIAAAVSCSADVPEKPLYFCASPSCPGYPYAASTLAHPPSCAEVKP